MPAQMASKEDGENLEDKEDDENGANNNC